MGCPERLGVRVGRGLEPVRTVVEVASRGKLVVGEPVLRARDADRPRSQVVARGRARRPGRGLRAAGAGRRSSACSGRQARIEAVLEGLLVERGARVAFEPCRPGGADRRGSGRSPRPDDVHDRPRHGEGLRRRDLGRARAGRRPRLGAHRRRLGVRPGGLGARSRGGRQRAFSTYVPGLVAPMLPPELSDDACSLRPHVDRLVRDRRVRRRTASRSSTARRSAATPG